MPTSDGDIPIEKLITWVVEILTARSMFKYDATRVAESIALAELAGIPDDGLAMLERLLTQIAKGDVDPRGRPVVLDEAPAMLFLDGSSAAGPVGLAMACRWLIEKAPVTGAAVAVVKGSREAGHPAIGVSMVAAAGLVGLCSTSSLRGKDATEATTRIGAAFPSDAGQIERFLTEDDSTLAVVLSALASGHTPNAKAASSNQSVAEHVVVAIDPARTTNMSRLEQKLREFPSAARVSPVALENGVIPPHRLEEIERLATSLKVANPWNS